MIDSVGLRNFKCWLDAEFSFRGLTVLTGRNASGKSSIVQAMLLAHQAQMTEGDRVPLNAEPGLELGASADVLSVAASTSDISIAISSDNGVHAWQFDASSAVGGIDDPFLRCVRKPAAAAPLGNLDASFVFLSAERQGPRRVSPVLSSRDVLAVGEDGRYVAQTLAAGGRTEVDVRRRRPGAAENATLQSQTEAWLEELVGPTLIDAQILPRTMLASAHFRSPSFEGEWMLPSNTGFGVSYSLPIVVAGLIVPENGLLIVDSPEAHLHPAAQSAVGAFLARVSASGAQVVIETHSDHVLNGIRREVAAAAVDPAQTIVHFFPGGAEHAELMINERGRISAWPEGFFDQFELDLYAINRRRGSE